MALTVLHTSDWHLGASLETAPRDEEQRRFLDWLLRTLAERRVDLLMVAGDVFHHAQPSAEAQQLYYRFLARLPETGVGRTIVVGGNHDSPSRLDAPRELLGALSIDVVGGVASSAEALERCLVPVTLAGELRAVVAAVPFIHEFRLGVRTTGLSSGEIAARFGEAFGSLYGELAERAADLSAGVPLLATGHLTVGTAGSCTGGRDFETEIHQVGTIGGLPAAIFDPRYAYVALGHIHRSYPVSRGGGAASAPPVETVADAEEHAPLLPGFAPVDEGPRAREVPAGGEPGPVIWYAGSPVALSYPESRTPRAVLLVSVDEAAGGGVEVERIPVPVERRLCRFEGPVEEVIDQLRAVEPGGDLEAYCAVDLRVASYRPEAVEEIHRAVAEIPASRRPRVVRVTQSLTGDGVSRAEIGRRLLDGRLADLDPEAVFVRLHELENAGEPPREELLAAFRALLVDPDQGDAR